MEGKCGFPSSLMQHRDNSPLNLFTITFHLTVKRAFIVYTLGMGIVSDFIDTGTAYCWAVLLLILLKKHEHITQGPLSCPNSSNTNCTSTQFINRVRKGA